MKQKVIDLFNDLGFIKLTFNPAIKLKMTPHSQPTWIDDMSRYNNNYMLTVSTLQDSAKKNLNDLTPEELQSLHTRLFALSTEKKKVKA